MNRSLGKRKETRNGSVDATFVVCTKVAFMFCRPRYNPYNNQRDHRGAHVFWCVVVGVTLLWSVAHWTVVYIAASDSVHGRVFFVVRDRVVQYGQLIALHTSPAHPVCLGRILIKYVGGCAGDEMIVRGSYVVVRGRHFFAQDGHPTVAPGIIPEGYIFVYGTHPLSYDSRYAAMGLVPLAQCIGEVKCVVA